MLEEITFDNCLRKENDHHSNDYKQQSTIVLDYDLDYEEREEIFQNYDLILCEKCNHKIGKCRHCIDCWKGVDIIERNRIEYGKCKECFQVLDYENCCLSCARKHLRQDFDKWTSKNKDIDKLIQDSQLSAVGTPLDILEWIPYNKFKKIKYIAEGGFAKVYSATWTDGRIEKWDRKSNNWKRLTPTKVALKVFNNSSKNLSEDFINEVKFFASLKGRSGLIYCHGVTQEPNMQNYAFVLLFMENGSLRSYLNQNFNSITWYQKLEIMKYISIGLSYIHHNNSIHKDLHLGNVLQENLDGARISDFGFCKPVDEISNSNSRNTYGVMPYMAPEILRGKEYTQKSDVYSLGIIMNEIISIVPPFNDVPHDYHLALDICHGKRPKIREETPEILKELIQECWDANPENRPTSIEVHNCVRRYREEPGRLKKLSYDFTESTNTKLFETHPQAVYTSRLLNFSNLPKPMNCPNQEKFISSRNDILRSECLDCEIID